MARTKIKNSFKYYWYLSTLRILLVFLPQSGYIHPDEFFQTIEALAGRIFEFDTSLPWEFNVTSPVRSIGVPYLTIGFSYHILNTINLFTKTFNISLITPYTLLIVPRLFMCLLTFLIDYSLYKICVINNEKYKARLIILASSYVTFIYGTRTFTNTIEMILFAVLLYYISESVIFSNIIVRQREYINKRYNNAKTPTDRAKFHKLRMFLASDSFRNCPQISAITVLGFFNRPTFLCFALFPIFFWLYRGIGYKSVTVIEFHTRMLVILICSILPVMFLIFVDSFFYGYISWGEIGMLDISINSFVFPPLNFIKYNLQESNLAKHGLHPRYLHVLINLPLLFNVLGLCGIFAFANMIMQLIKKKFHLLPTVRSIKGLMTVSFIAPIFFLSFFPHQEPRFLLPIILPLTYLYSHYIYKEPDYELVTVNEAPQKEIVEKRLVKTQSYFLLRLWLGFNVICGLYFGMLQQGGVFPAARYLSEEINAKPYFNYHIVTSHMYSIPHVFFMQPDTDKLFYKKNLKYQISKHVFTYEEGSKNLDSLFKQVLTILKVSAGIKRRYKLYLLISGSLENKLYETYKGFVSNFTLSYKANFYPHFSAEAPPDLTDLIHILSNTNLKDIEMSSFINCLYNVFTSFSTKIYEISLVNLNAM